MEDFLTPIRRRIEELEQEINYVRESLKQAPEGTLRISSSRREVSYYHYLKGKQTYLRKDEQEKKLALAAGGYYRDVLPILEKEKRLLETFLKRYDVKAAIHLYERQSEERRKLIRPVELPDDLFVKQWEEKQQKLLESRPIGFTPPEEFRTSRGEFVRSKSELILAELFDRNHIPYFYEVPMKTSRHLFYPDFTLLNVRTRKTYFWEHLGKMQDPEYVNRNLIKISAFSQAGIYAGEHLIMTFETDEQPLSTSSAEAYIRHFLV